MSQAPLRAGPVKRPSDAGNVEAGRSLVLAGRAALFLAALAPVLPLVNVRGASVTELIVRIVGGAAAGIMFGVVGILTVSYGRRLQVPPGELTPGAQGRPRVLYLRSFSMDSDIMPGTEESQAMLPTAEERLRDRLAGVGEMVAIGRPSEHLPPIGVPRIYRNDDEWRAAILDLMRSSPLTVLAYGASSGLLWEIYSALEHVPAERLLLWFPTRDRWHAFQAFARTDPHWTRGLPSTGADVHLLAFYPNGTLRVLEVHGTTVINDFSSDDYPDATEPGDVSPGGFEAYIGALPTVPRTVARIGNVDAG